MNISAVNDAYGSYAAFTDKTKQVGEKVTVKLAAQQIDEAVKTGRADTLVLSEEARSKLDKIGKAVKEKNAAAANMYELQNELVNAKKNADAMAESAGYELKMFEIARRLQHGDKVPYQDERALLEFDDKLYQVSKQIGMMRQNEERKEYDSLLEDKEETQEYAQPEPPVEAGAAVSGSEGVEVTAGEVSETTLE